jgi:DNA repair exonuclease SbcCD ATPase subunit
MTDGTATIQALRDRLTGLLADWGTELATVLKELEEKRARVAELEGNTASREELETLRQRIDGQNTLIEALRGDAEEASKLRTEVRNRDLELERVNSELESKKELVRALRRDTDGNERLKSELRHKDKEIEELKNKLQRAERQAGDAAEKLAGLREAAAGRASEEEAEIESLRAELEARKSVIKGLRADQERVSSLQASLVEKSEIIEQLEASINRHSNTIAELRRSADTWKRKYQAQKGDSPTATTSVNLPSLSDTDVRVIEELEKKTTGGIKQEATIAIDMRRSLLEARRTAAKGSEK